MNYQFLLKLITLSMDQGPQNDLAEIDISTLCFQSVTLYTANSYWSIANSPVRQCITNVPMSSSNTIQIEVNINFNTSIFFPTIQQ